MEHSKNIRKIKTMIDGYYFLAACSAIMLVLASFSSLLVYSLSSILTPVCWFACFLGVLSSLIRFSHICDTIQHFPKSSKETEADAGKKKAKPIVLWVAAEVLLIVAGLYPLFPFWLRALFMAPALTLLLCGLLWNSKSYRNFKQYIT